MAKRTHAHEAEGMSEEGDLMELMPLGAGQEVGRSCLCLKYKGKTVMVGATPRSSIRANRTKRMRQRGKEAEKRIEIGAERSKRACCRDEDELTHPAASVPAMDQFDCGIHPGYSGIVALPFFDEIDPAEVDVLLVTHFHLDHSASLPYFLQKTTFKGRVFMTHSTKAIYRLLVSDYVKISKVAVDDMLFDEHDLNNTMDKIEVIDYHQQVEVDGIRFWGYVAGHVLGAAMFMVDIAGTRVLYTGDYSREEDRHLKAAEIPEVSPDVCVCESTYGVQSHQPRKDRERRFTEVISGTVLRGGRVLLPVFALGRAQELLLILDEYWAAHPELHSIPIYFASPLAKRCMTVFQTYINSMNDRIRAQYQVSNPFMFKHIQSLKGMSDFDDIGPSVVMASPGMLQSGLSRQLFDAWCQDARNTCVIAGYSVEGTLAKHILSEPKEVTLMSGQSVPLKMAVHYISFSAHADYTQTSEFLDIIQCPNIVLVHGEANEMGRLKAALQHKFESAGKKVQVLNPKNCQTVQMHFKTEKVAKAVGSFAQETPKEGDKISGLLVKKGFSQHLMKPSDLDDYTQLSTISITQKQSLPFHHSFESLEKRLKRMYDGVECIIKQDLECLAIGTSGVFIYHESTSHLVLEWDSGPISDMIADSVVAIVLQMDANPVSDMGPQKLAGQANGAPYAGVDAETLKALLYSIFGDVEQKEGSPSLTVRLNSKHAEVVLETKEVISDDEELKERIEKAIQRIDRAMYPLSCC